MSSAISYLRVSTDQQGRSGLGLEAQRLAISRFCERRGLELVREFVDIQTGRRDHIRNRPGLTSAIATARRSGAVIVVARLDRLSRSTLVTAQLLASKVEFIAADAPDATRISLQLSALMAEYESRLISERTKDGMRAAQARGVSFARHSWNFTAETRLKAATNARKSHIDRAKEAYSDIAPDAVALRAKGKRWTSIARYLNQQGHVTRSGGQWGIKSVQRLVRRETESVEQRSRLVLTEFRQITTAAPPSSHVTNSSAKAIADSQRPLPVAQPSHRGKADIGRAVLYCRISSHLQSGNSSLESQLEVASRFCKESNLNVVASYLETERAWRTKLADRPKLLEAISHAKAAQAKLVISRLDRLARNVSIVSGLMDSRISFVVADAPWASDLTLHMLAAMAQEESRLISSRMKEVRAAAKLSGRIWKQVNNLKREDQKAAQDLSAAIRIKRTREVYAYIEPIAKKLREAGESMPKIATQLNQSGFRTQRNTPWNAVSVCHLLRRVGAAPPHRSRAERALSES